MVNADLRAAILKDYDELQEQTGVTGPVVGTLPVAPGKFAVLKYPLTLAEALQTSYELRKPAKRTFCPSKSRKSSLKSRLSWKPNRNSNQPKGRGEKAMTKAKKMAARTIQNYLPSLCLFEVLLAEQIEDVAASSFKFHRATQHAAGRAKATYDTPV